MAGWSTAPDIAREMGFGAGMGLPNIKKNADQLNIETVVGQGTTVTIEIKYR
jgi:serine/threonine-protein kinase RsbT